MGIESAIEVAWRADFKVGESILWDDRTGHLWWIDIGTPGLHGLDLAANTATHHDLPSRPGCLALGASGQIVVGLEDGLYRIDPGSGQLSFLAAAPMAQAPSRFNDSAVSPDGRLFAGHMPLGDRSGAASTITRYDGNGSATLRAGLCVPNGMAFSPDGSTFYASDSWPSVRRIWRHDYDAQTGMIGAPSLFFDTHEIAGRPDGAAIDADGAYWMAGVGGGEIVRIDPHGRVDRRIALPVSHPTKPCFGGTDRKTLFVTSIGLDAGIDGVTGELSGSILALQVDIPGMPETRLAIG